MEELARQRARELREPAQRCALLGTPSAASSGPASRTGVRSVTATAAARQARLTWPRLPAAAELAATGAGYAAYSLIRLAIRAGH